MCKLTAMIWVLVALSLTFVNERSARPNFSLSGCCQRSRKLKFPLFAAENVSRNRDWLGEAIRGVSN